MTSPLVEPVVADPELDPEADAGAGEEDSSAESATPWTRLGRRDGSQSGQPSVTAPGGNGSGSSADPGSQSAVPGQPQAGAGSGQGGRGAVAPPAGAGAPGASVPGQPGAPTQSAPAQAAPAPAGAVAPNTSQTTDAAAADPTGGLLNPETLTALAPSAMMAGAMMLPMIASALAGLGGGSGSGSGSGGSGGETGTSGGLTPEAQQAIDVLKQLKDVYGTNDTDADAETPTSGKQLGSTTSSGTGSGVTASKVKAHQLYQRNAATAFNNLDNDLVNYMRSMAGNHKVDRKAVVALIRDVDVQLAEIGSAAYTKAGQQKVHQILTNALAKAAKIVSGGNSTATGTAAEINRLTNQYIYNLAGREYKATAASGASGATTAAAQQAVSVAMAQQGDPYVWGAEGPNSFDCSGLMQYSARAAGVNIPRVAADQYRQLPKVNPRDIRPGDLIFPDSSFNNGNPGHVMMYIGNGQCVEAPRTGLNVRVVNLPNGYHASRWS